MRIYKNQVFPSDLSLCPVRVRELCDPNFLHINRLQPRATAVPAQQSHITYRNKEASDRIFSLNGNYRFALFSDAAPEDFEKPGFDDASWDILDVPSMWQFRGFGEPTYPNVEYPFPFDPPYIDRLNPVGCYRRTFRLNKTADRTVLHFEGVDNAFYVYLNGTFVGFSKGSRLPAEFDVSSLVTEGENLLAVKVYTYSDASYLENQDMLLASGIFRDVYLIFSPACSLWDQHIYTDRDTLHYTATLWEETENASLRLTFDGETVTLPFTGREVSCTLPRGDRNRWNAEQPFLYALTAEVLQNGQTTETHFKKVGFVDSGVADRAFCINGSPVMLRGINRHENDSRSGRYITVEQIEKDLSLIKANNINAIRCSHYPNNPAFYEIASEKGIFVMDEGDLESHGCGVTGDQGFLTKSPTWLNAYLDRTRRMAERDKNETCIVIWSVGNEYGTGENAEGCAAYLRSLADKKPVFYSAPDPKDRLFIGCGYCNIFHMEKIHQQYADSDKPVCMIEYGHAMGNSPGNLNRLWEYNLSHSEFTGGFVWEFRSHGKRRENADGTVDYLYGGDFHDTNHWSNFTLDGYCTSDGTPKPTFRELKQIYCPVRLAYENGVLSVDNRFDFRSTEGIAYRAVVSSDGKTCAVYEGLLPALAPRTTGSLPLPVAYTGYACFLTVELTDTDGSALGFKQFALPAVTQKPCLPRENQQVEAVRENDKLTFTGKNFIVRFANGVPVYYEKDQKCYFDTPMQFVVYRAETDNDGIVKLYPRWIGTWEQFRLPFMRFFCYQTAVTAEENAQKIVCTGRLTADHCYTGFDITLVYTLSHNGLLTVDMTVKPYGNMPHLHSFGSMGEDDRIVSPRLPRFGVCFTLSDRFDTAAWFGRGKDQSYKDSVQGAPVGVYTSPVDALNFAYDVPQETGNHEDTYYLCLKDRQNAFTVYGNDTFAFSVHPWQLDVLRAARHPSELKKDGNHYLYIDYRMRALGSFSCGPNPEREDDFEPHDFRFVFAFNGETGETPSYALCDLGAKTQALSGLYERKVIEAERNEVECRSVETEE